MVFIGPYEHHSNELPWRESIADVVVIDEDADGRIDLDHLEERLVEYADRPLKIGSFSAASNVTGIAVRRRRRSASCCTAHGALSFWDYAAAGPYVEIDMNPRESARTRPRTRSSSRRTSSSAVRARPECWSPSGAVLRTACRRCRAAARWPTSTPHEHRYLQPTRAARRGRHAGDRRVDPRRARLPAQGGGGRRT